MLNSQKSTWQPQPNVLARGSMAEAGRKVLNLHFQRMLQNEVGTRLGEDIESLHDMRVATRRMRAAFRVFKPYYRPAVIKHHLKGLKTTGRILGAVRDWDVLLEKTQIYVDALNPGERSRLKFLVDSWFRKREAACEQMLTYLDGETYRDFKYTFSEFVHIPGDKLLDLPPKNWMVYEAAPQLFLSRYELVLTYDEKLLDPSLEQLHALRIDFKRLRYTIEFFREVLGETADFCIAELKRLQDHLGDLNDAGLAIQKIQRFFVSQDSHPAAVASLDDFLEVKTIELNELKNTFPVAWQRFRQPEFRQNLDEALKVLRNPI